MDLGLKDRVILISGGASGIGEAITRACLNEDAVVIVVSRINDHVNGFLTEMRQQQRRCDFFEAELADPDQCRHAVEHVQSAYGRLDALVNNAGVNDNIGLANGDPARFMASLRQNLLHYYALAHYALPMLIESKGSILNISSKVAITGQSGTSAYAAAKGAQLALTREWAAELFPFGIRVNSILPAEVMTPLYEQWIQSREDPAAEVRRIASKIPLGRRMTLDYEIASTAVFLLSPTHSAHTTAQHLSVDGGYVHLDRSLT